MIEILKVVKLHGMPHLHKVQVFMLVLELLSTELQRQHNRWIQFWEVYLNSFHAI